MKLSKSKKCGLCNGTKSLWMPSSMKSKIAGEYMINGNRVYRKTPCVCVKGKKPCG